MNKRSTVAWLMGVAVFGAMREPMIGTVMAQPAQPARQQPAEPERPSTARSHEARPAASRGRLGVSVLPIGPELRAHLGAASDRGVLVETVRPDSPAARAGVRVGDVIVEVDAAPVRSGIDVLEAIGERRKGETVPIAVIRDGQRAQLRVTLTEDPGPVPPVGRSGSGGQPWLDEVMPMMPGMNALRGSLDDARRRIDELERRVEALERK